MLNARPPAARALVFHTAAADSYGRQSSRMQVRLCLARPFKPLGDPDSSSRSPSPSGLYLYPST